MKIIIAADQKRYDFKESLKQHLKNKGHQVIDLSTNDENDPAWFMKTGRAVAQAIADKKGERGIVMCGTGVGIGMAANKCKGALCAIVESYWAAVQSRKINNANIMAIGGSTIGLKLAYEMVDAFVETEFLQGLSPQDKERLGKAFDKWAELEDSIFNK